MKQLFFLLLFLSLYACNSGNGNSSGAAVSADLSGYELVPYQGTDISKAIKMDKDGSKILEEGEILKGQKNGTWITYHTQANNNESIQRVKSISSYVNGQLSGVHMEFNNRGQVEKQCFYENGEFHGEFVKFKYGSRIEEEKTYNHGKLTGVFKKYDPRGKIQQEIHYKDNVQHGPLRYYDEEGNITMEYQYENGKKISGGIVEKPKAEETKK